MAVIVLIRSRAPITYLVYKQLFEVLDGACTTHEVRRYTTGVPQVSVPIHLPQLRHDVLYSLIRHGGDDPLTSLLPTSTASSTLLSGNVASEYCVSIRRSWSLQLQTFPQMDHTSEGIRWGLIVCVTPKHVLVESSMAMAHSVRRTSIPHDRQMSPRKKPQTCAITDWAQTFGSFPGKCDSGRLSSLRRAKFGPPQQVRKTSIKAPSHRD